MITLLQQMSVKDVLHNIPSETVNYLDNNGYTV